MSDEAKPRKPRGNIERGWVRHALIRDLAKAEQNQHELAEKYGVTQPAVANFQRRHADEILDVIRQADAEFVGLWVAEKRNRLAELEQDIEDLIEHLETDELEPSDRAAYLSAKRATLKQVAEELGQLLNRTSLQHSGEVQYRYLTDNVNDTDLV